MSKYPFNYRDEFQMLSIERNVLLKKKGLYYFEGLGLSVLTRERRNNVLMFPN
jgi:hypothetical protein